MCRLISIATVALALAITACSRSPGPATDAGTVVPASAVVLPSTTPNAATTPAPAGQFAWPTSLPPGQQLDAARSTFGTGSLTLAFADPANPQHELTITSRPDPDGGFGAPCREAVTVRGVAGAACSTGAGVTVAWVENGWRYQVGGGLLTTEAALALAEDLELVSHATAAQRLEAAAAP